MGEAEDQGLDGCKGASDKGASLTKTGLVGVIDRSIREPVVHQKTRYQVGGSKGVMGSEQ